MEIFNVDNTSEITALGIRDWVIDLLESKKVWGDSINSAMYVLTKYSRNLEDGTTLELLYVDDERDAQVINRKGDEIYCGYFLFNYKSSFGDPLPYLIRTVIDLDFRNTGNKITLRTKYMEIEARVEADQEQSSSLSTEAVLSTKPLCNSQTKVNQNYIQASLF